MKTFYAFFVAVMLAVPTLTTSAAIVIDGTADADYGSAIVTQQLGTTELDNNKGLVDESNGSELDAAYGVISNGVLYLVLAGNIDSDIGESGSGYDKLQVFFMTGPGGDHTLGTNYNGAVDFGHFNRMGTDGADLMSGGPGLTFESGFAPNYWIGTTVGSNGPGPTMYVNYMQVCSNCFGAYLGSVSPSNTPPNNIFVDGQYGTGIQAALNNSNILGVAGDPSGCYTTGAPYNPQDVRTGLELAIPLSAIGSPTGQVSICAFLVSDAYDVMYNQVLGPIWDGTTGFCKAGNEPDYVDFSSGAYPGTQSFSIQVPPCDVINASSTFASYNYTGGVASVSVYNSGCPLTVTPSTNWISIISSVGLATGNGTFTYSVSTNNNSVTSRTGYIFITDTEGSGNIVTQTVTISQTGIPSGPLSPYITIDGTVDPTYGCPIVVQQLGTAFGDNSFTNLLNAGGSELDAAYGIVQNNVLFITLAGNLQFNYNEIQIFLMTDTNGVSTLSTNNYGGVGGNAINSLASQGFTFDGGFAPNYWIGVNGGGTPSTLYFDYAQLWPEGTNATGVATNGHYLGYTVSTNGTLFGGANPFGIQGTINNSQTNGVDGTSCNTNYLGQAQSLVAAAVTNGLELGIPLAAIGSPTGAVYVCAILTGSGNHAYLSNQFLPPIGTNGIGDCQGVLANSNNVSLADFPGGPHYFAVGPEVRITSVNRSGNAINVNYLTEANTNLTYQLQRTAVYTNNAVWSSVGGIQLGTGGILTGTDPFGATNVPAQFYRVRQTPLCP
ncbi:MAG TPA: BACON domain-containing protein [Verrucomicrobiae bacterium]|nr:BACON domain-containing protein [Verrucomicrobiae bacterium]